MQQWMQAYRKAMKMVIEYQKKYSGFTVKISELI